MKARALPRMLEHLFSVAVYKGGSVGCDPKFKFDIT